MKETAQRAGSFILCFTPISHFNYKSESIHQHAHLAFSRLLVVWAFNKSRAYRIKILKQINQPAIKNW